MLTKMILKMLLKACVPLAIIIGFSSYVLYTKGGDPGAIFAKIGGGIFSQAKDSVQSAGQSIDSMSPLGEHKSTTEVFKWVDQNGVTHFSTTPPIDYETTSIKVNPNRNVVSATPVEEFDKYDAQVADKMNETLEGLPDESLPGAAGMQLPFEMDEQTLNNLLKSVQPQ